MSEPVVEWLRDVHEQVEEAAQALGGARWTAAIDAGDGVNLSVVTTRQESELARAFDGTLMVSPGEGDVATCAADWQGGTELAAHIAAHDPAAVLARVAAEREILDHHERWQATRRETPEGWTEQGCTAYRMAMSWVVEQLAAGWSTREHAA
jgi:phosphoglycolate phosphatase-like HAD superfamily hydrolase